MNYRQITAILLFMLTVHLYAQSFGHHTNWKDKYIVKDGLCYYYNEESGTATVASKKKFDKKVNGFWRSQYKEEHLKILPEIIVKGRSYKVTNIAYEAFKHSPIKSVEIPNTISVIDYDAFAHCINLESVTIPGSVKCLSGFYDCVKLKSVNIPNSVDTIGRNAFAYCKSLTEVVIPNSVRSIGNYAFMECDLTKVHIPNSVKYIGVHCFADNNNLLEAIVPDDPVEMDDKYSSTLRIFNDCDKLELVRGNTLPYCPEYMISQIESSSPFKSKGILDRQKNSFSYFAFEQLRKKIEEWEKKKEYETVAQWKKRVTEENRQKQVTILIEKLKGDYIIKKAPTGYSAEIGDYDADYQTFPVVINKLNTVYVKVPTSDAQEFKTNWDKVIATPIQYGIIDDQLGIISCTFHYGKKQYQLSQTYPEDGTDFTLNLSPLNLDIGNDNSQLAKQQKQDYTIDLDIPTNTADNKQTFAVIIGNERYTQVAQVPFANNDARIFAEYCRKTLGLPAKNVKVYENATYGTMIGAVSDIQKIARAFKGDINVIFYYAGHGIPDEATGDGYLLPIDADGMNMRVCYPLSQLYKDLGSMQARSVTCFMDACFSGAQRGNGMLVAARGVTIKAKNDHPTGNTVVFTAATDKQTAYPYEEKGHGMFTYYLLKKLRDTKGDCTLGELGTYICDEVAKQAVVTNGKEQTPVVLTSGGVADSWKTMKLK